MNGIRIRRDIQTNNVIANNGFKIPRYNNLTEIGNQPGFEGDIIFDRNTNALCVSDGTIWKCLIGGSGAQGPQGDKGDTGVSAADYVCGVNGYKAERVQLLVRGFGLMPWDLDQYVAGELLTVKTIVENGYWTVYANIAHLGKAEDWTVNVLCVKRGIAVEGMPPNE